MFIPTSNAVHAYPRIHARLSAQFGRQIQTIQPDVFLPAKNLKGQKRFAVIGDAGSGTDRQWDIANRMKETYEKSPFSSVLVLGDNVYEDGEPDLFKERIYKPYEPLFKEGVHFYPVMGNHDVRKGHRQEQLNYWGVPGFYNFKMGQDVEFFAIDTTLFLPGYDHCYMDRPFWARTMSYIEYQWLDKALSESKAKFKIVYGHYPLYSSGMHAKKAEMVKQFRDRVEPLLIKHGVNLYLAGHEHHYEKSKVIGGIQHIVSGAGGKVRKIFYQDNPPYPREMAMAKSHFMLFDITDSGLSYQVISRKGNVLDSGLIPPHPKKLLQYA